MAQVIPSTPQGSLPSEVLKAYKFLKSLPDDYLIWHHLTPWDREAPDFLVINPEKRALVVKVSSATAKSNHPAAQLLLLGESTALGEEDERPLSAFFEKLDAPLRDCISAVVVFPNLRSDKLGVPSGDPARKYHWVGQDTMQGVSVDSWRDLFACEPLTDLSIDRIRAVFTPEIVIPESLTVRTPDPDRHEAHLKGYLLDILQESAVKNDLDLPVEQERASKDLKVGIINGVAGSGKTLILLYRLRLLHSFFPSKRFLVLTHNRPLIRDIRARYHGLAGKLPGNIDWKTFNAFCWSNWPETEYAWIEPLGQAERERIAEGIWKQYFEGTSIRLQGFLDEIDWLKDQIPMNRSAYLAVERKGRGFRLNQEQRARMWEAITAYQNQINSLNKTDWGDVPRRMWNFMRENKVHLPQYDFILVDEAQFFAPIWFDIVLKLLKPGVGSLFIVADPTQGFLGRGTSWKSLGIDARGKTQSIRRSYRTTHEILNFATLLYRRRMGGIESDEEILKPDLLNMPHGVLPVMLPLRSPQDEIARVTVEIEALHGNGVPLNNILVLHSDWTGVDALLASLNRRLGDGSAVDPKDAAPDGAVRVTTLNAGTGLESQIVFLVGLNRLFESEQSLRLSDDDVERLVLENTRKVYMAATRAGQRLVITYVGKIPEVLLDLTEQRAL